MRQKKSQELKYTIVTIAGIKYYRARRYNADGKRFDINARSVEELAVKVARAEKETAETIARRTSPTVKEYSEKWLSMQEANIRPSTLRGYTYAVNKYIIAPLGDLLLAEVTADDIKLAMVPVSKKAAGLYSTVNMLFKSIFYSAEHSNLLIDNPTKNIIAKGGIPQKEKEALTDEQVALLLDTVRELPPYVFVMLGLYAGLRREEILGLKWDCVFLDETVPYIAVRKAWHVEHNRPIVTTDLKTKAAKRDIPIPDCLVKCLREAKKVSVSEYVISDRNGEPLADSQFRRIWNYITVRSTKERTLYKYVNGQAVRKTFKPEPGQRCVNRESIVYCLDFKVTPHILRHTYITNLIHAGVDPKTVQYLAGHENSKVTMDIYAKAKYNKPEILSAVVNNALQNGDITGQL